MLSEEASDVFQAIVSGSVTGVGALSRKKMLWQFCVGVIKWNN